MKQLVMSYAREDRDKVEDLVGNLKLLDYQVWVDSALRGGQQWWDAILTRIEECDALIVAVSPASLNSDACQRERRYADVLGKPIVPVAVAPTTQAMPRELAARQIIDWTTPGKEQAFRLAGDLAHLPPAAPLPSVMPPKPPAPLSYMTDLVEQAAASSLTQAQQREILDKIETALRSADVEEQSSAAAIRDRMLTRGDLFADVDRRLQSMQPLALGSRPELPPPSPPPPSPAVVDQTPAIPPQQRSKAVTILAVIGAIFIALVVIGMLSGTGNCGYDYYGNYGCY